MAKTPHALESVHVLELKGVGPVMANRLASLGIESVQDVLFHLPLRYQDRTHITPIGALQAGNDVVIEGEIKAADIVFGRRRSLVCRLQDNTGTITLRFFHFSAAQKQHLHPGTPLRCFGEVRRGASGLELYHPEYRKLGPKAPQLEQSLTPIYPSTDGISQQSWRNVCQQALSMLQTHTLHEYLPQCVLPSNEQVTLHQALEYLHNPPPNAAQSLLREGIHPYQQRLAFEELLAHNLSLLRVRQDIQNHGAPRLTGDKALLDQFLDRLGFSLTGAQQRVEEQVASDLASNQPMLRLVQGDVGSGKTVVAAIAALRAATSGYQVAIMAPTEILAEQHFTNFSHWLAPLNINLAWLTGKVKGKKRKEQLQAIATHQANIIIGTHALFQPDVQFARLGLVIIDEQHRFGVHQRLALKEKANDEVGLPHQMVMTATPIPRTLAMSAYANLDTSIIDELPPGRTPVNTVVLDNHRRTKVIERLRSAFANGRQAYWVCTLVEQSDVLEAEAAEQSRDTLCESLPEYRIGLIHGRMKADEKLRTMQAFKSHELDLLVATTVIEVGVDVPNASLMIIDNAERLGLAQLHQLRGRVGRGNTASHCVLLYQSPLSYVGKQRLQIMRDSNDGFVIAEKDLELRGPGELLGTRQTGLLHLRIADIQRDHALLEPVNTAAKYLSEHYPQSIPSLIKRWLPNGDQYAQV